MKIAFLTEMGFHGSIHDTHENMRTEFAWMCALNATHYNIYDWKQVSGYDYVMLIFPKGQTFLNSIGCELINGKNQYSDLLKSNIVSDLKSTNTKVCSIQEGPTWYVNDLDLIDQFNIHNQLFKCDIIFAHNMYDVNWYKGLFPSTQVEIMPTLIIDTLVKDIIPNKENKTIIGGNFSRWYGGFQSYNVASDLPIPIYVQTSHSSRPYESSIENLSIIPRVSWITWMNILSTFKFAIHLMPTVAAGTFSLNCAYFGIPCIGNIDVDTQRICFPDLSVRAEDVYTAKQIINRLYSDSDFYEHCSTQAKTNYKSHFTRHAYIHKLQNILV